MRKTHPNHSRRHVSGFAMRLSLRKCPRSGRTFTGVLLTRNAVRMARVMSGSALSASPRLAMKLSNLPPAPCVSIECISGKGGRTKLETAMVPSSTSQGHPPRQVSRRSGIESFSLDRS